MRSYWTAFRLRARLETTYRGAALGALGAQLFFALILIALYRALYAGSGGSGPPLWETVNYVWIQQICFRALYSAEMELLEGIRTGAIAYALCRPVSPYGYWFARSLSQKVMGTAMRALPLLVIALIMPPGWRLTPPDSLLALGQFALSLGLGFLFMCGVDMLRWGITLRALDHRGISGVIQALKGFLSGNLVPLTLFPERWQALIRYQPFAQGMDAPIRFYAQAQPWAAFGLHLAIQLFWVLLTLWGSWALWRRNLPRLPLQGG